MKKAEDIMAWYRIKATHRWTAIVALHGYVVRTRLRLIRRRDQVFDIGALNVDRCGSLQVGMLSPTFLAFGIGYGDTLAGVIYIQKSEFRHVLLGIIMT